MRPDRFQTLVINQLIDVPGIKKAESFDNTGNAPSSYGLVIHHDHGVCTWWQIAATSRPGDDYSQPEGTPATGERQAVPALPDLTGTKIPADAIEATLAAALLHADTAGEVARIARYSQRNEPGAVSHGLTIGFHDGSKIFVNGLGATRPGEQPRKHDLYKTPATV